MVKKAYTKKEIYEGLQALAAPRDSIVLMHTSMRSVGDVEGGASALLDVMIDYFTGGGGLFCVPTHTWHNLDNPESRFILDVTSPDTCLGAFSNIAVSHPGGIRTENPTHSMVIFGDRDRAISLCSLEDKIDTPIAPEGCYGSLYRMGGKILLVGVGQTKNTFIHTAEEMVGIPNRMTKEPDEYTVRRASGELIKRKMKMFYTDYTDDISYRFFKYELPLRYHGAIRDGFIGDAPTQLCDARKIEETIRLIYECSKGIDPLASEDMIPPSWYVKTE